jgi:hypothetical protein
MLGEIIWIVRTENKKFFSFIILEKSIDIQNKGVTHKKSSLI